MTSDIFFRDNGGPFWPSLHGANGDHLGHACHDVRDDLRRDVRGRDGPFWHGDRDGALSDGVRLFCADLLFCRDVPHDVHVSHDVLRDGDRHKICDLCEIHPCEPFCDSHEFFHLSCDPSCDRVSPHDVYDHVHDVLHDRHAHRDDAYGVRRARGDDLLRAFFHSAYGRHGDDGDECGDLLSPFFRVHHGDARDDHGRPRAHYGDRDDGD